MTVNINAASISSARFVEQASNPATPSSGSVRLFVDNSTVYNNTLGSNTPLLKMIADDGTVTTFIGNVTTSGVGITFPPQQVASSNVNTLDDYEEGTWDPSYTTDSNPFGSITYTSNRAAVYTKVARLVTVSFIIETSSITLGSASGNVLIGNLPFTPASIGVVPYTGTISFAFNFADDRPSSITARPGTNSAFLYYRDTADGNSLTLVPADLALGATSNLMYGAFMYVV